MKITILTIGGRLFSSLRHLLFMLCVVIIHSVQAQWEQVQMDGGAAVINFLVSDSVQMVTTPYNYYVSFDVGESWNRVSSAPGSIRQFSLADSFWFVGTYANGIFVTTNKGGTWEPRNAGISTLEVAIMAANLKRIAFYSSTGSRTLYVSDDGGLNWQSLADEVYGISLIQDTVIFTTPYFERSLSILTGSRLSGYKVAPIVTPGNVVFKYMTTIDDKIFAATGSSIYLQAHRGSPWTNLRMNLPSPNISKLFTHASDLYIVNNSSVYRFETDVKDSAWVKQFDIPPEIRDIQIGSGYLLASSSTQNGMLKSSDNGASWHSINNGLTELAGGDFFTKDSLLLATINTKGLMSTSNGVNWKLYSAYQLSQFCFHKGYLFAYASGIYRSSDLGVTWESKTSGITSYAFDWKLASNDSFIVCSTNAGGVFLSSDAGGTWVNITSSIGVDQLQSCFVDNGIIYVGSAGGSRGLSRSSNRGNSWSRSTIGNSLFPLVMKRFGSNLYLGTSSGIYESTDGVTWDYLNLGGIRIDHLMNADSSVVASGDGNGIRFSPDLGRSWKSVQNNLPSYSLSDIVLYQGKTYVTTNSSGIWYRSVADMHLTGVSTKSSYPTSFVLSQNFPNPFNPATTIRFVLPTRSRVRLIISNMLGQQVAVLENGEREAGHHEDEWHANVASGIYFYRIQATSIADPAKYFVDTKKMLLLK